MTETSKIIDGLKEAIAGDFPAVTIDGVRWVRESALLAAERRGVKVKPLEWVSEPPFHIARHAWGFYSIEVIWTDHRVDAVELRGTISLARSRFRDIDAAKAAAQADYEARIRSALAPEGDGWPRAGDRVMQNWVAERNRVEWVVVSIDGEMVWLKRDNGTEAYTYDTIGHLLPSPPKATE